jgi:hypothetical protein
MGARIIYMGPTQPLIQQAAGDSPKRSERPKRDANQAIQSSKRLNMMEVYLHAFMGWCLLKRKNFTLSKNVEHLNTDTPSLHFLLNTI